MGPERIQIQFPESDEGFERLCRNVLRREWRSSDLDRLGRPGQRQHGIDLLGTSPDGACIAAQCKLRTAKKLSIAEIIADVQRADASGEPLASLTFVTTMRRDVSLQREVLSLHRKRIKAKQFRVQIMFWDELEEMLHRHQDLRDEYLGRLPANAVSATEDFAQHVAGLVLERVVASGAGPNRGGEDKAIDRAFQFATEGDPARTISLLENIREERWSSFDDRLKYRVLANLGTAHLLLGHDVLAADLLLKARSHHTSPNSQALEALAYDLKGDSERAHAIALEACRADPVHARAHAIRLRTQPWPTLADAEESVPAECRTNAEVAFALHNIAREHDDLDAAERHSRAVIADEPGWPQGIISLSAVVIEQWRRSSPRSSPDIRSPALLAKREEAEALLSDLIERLTNSGNPAMLGAAHYNRATLRRVKGDEDGARCDVEVAARLSPTDATVVATAALELDRRGNSEAAIRMLAELPDDDKSPRSRLLLAMMLKTRGETGDAARALQELRRAAADSASCLPEVRFEIGRQIAKHVQKQDDPTAAEEARKTVGELRLGRCGRLALDAEILDRSGDSSAAVAMLRDAPEIAWSGENWFERLHFAKLARRLGLKELARRSVEDWGASPSAWSECVAELMQCAVESNDDALVLGIARSLRSSGVYEAEAVEAEVGVLCGCDERRQALDVLTQWLERRPDDSLVRLWRSEIALEIGDTAMVSVEAKHLPDPLKCSLRTGCRVVQLLLEANDERAQALEYAYIIFRRFRGEQAAWRALVWANFHPRHAGEPYAPPTRVSEGCAACLRNSRTKELRWVVIEPSDDADAHWDEWGSASPLAAAVLGKGIGELVRLGEDQIQPQQFEIVSIDTSQAYRARKCAEDLGRRFPQDGAVQLVHVGEIEEDATREQVHDALQPLTDAAEAKRQWCLTIEAQHRATPMPIALFAKRTGVDLFEAFQHIVATEGLRVFCSDGSAASHERATSGLQRASTLVVEPTALCTMVLLEAQVPGVMRQVSQSGLNVVATAGAIREFEKQAESLRQVTRRAKRDGQAMSMAPVNGAPVCQVISAADVESSLRLFETTWGRVREGLEIKGGEAVTELAPERRTQIERVCGPGVAQALALARRLGCPLWTDEYYVGIQAQEDGIAWCWTNALWRHLEMCGAATVEQADEVSAYLCSAGYVFTSLRWSAVLTACKRSEWNPDKTPAKRVLDSFGEEGVEAEELLHAFLSVVSEIWRTAPTVEARNAVVIRMMEQVGLRRDGNGLIARASKHIEMFFGVDPIGGRQAKALLREWLAQRATPSERILSPFQSQEWLRKFLSQ